MKRSLVPVKNAPTSNNQIPGKEGLKKLLKQHFGYSEFRGKQLEAIGAVLSGRDCFCLMPTGGGKSMCYQIPALAKPGIVLVISPLIALMENQVTLLKRRGIPAEFLSSTQTTITKEKILEDLNSGKPSVRLLYVTPELVATFGFKTKLARLYGRGLLSLIAIDEAHCISTWGHDFRPSYRKLSSLRSQLPDVPLLALTATAVPKVQKDVIESLCLQHPLILRASFNRPNIFYEVRYKDLLDDAYTDLSYLLKSSRNVCSIVYCLERSTCDDLSNHLLKDGISSAAYHAGLNNKLRSTVLDDWLSSKIQVVVATVAFGMGIDRGDVRIVCHFNTPKSMEAFYQESGRAGRDQLPSRSVLYYGLDDRKKMEFILRNTASKKSQSSCSSDNLSEKSLADFTQMVEYCEGSGCRRKKVLESFGEQVSASFCRKSCDSCKHPSLVLTHLEELRCVPSINKKGGLPQIFTKSSDSTFDGQESEFWNRDDEACFSDEDISDSDDEVEAVCNLVRSKMSSKAGLHEKFEVLKRAEELYYDKETQNKQVDDEETVTRIEDHKVLNKENGVVDKKAVTETLREASKTRLLNAMKQAQERLGKPLLESEASATFLEMECFKKYGKVGRTFYNSQLAATVRWLSSSSYEQIHGRLSANPVLASGQRTPSSLPSVTAMPMPNPSDRGQIQAGATDEKTRDDAWFKGSNGPVQMEVPKEKMELPPIPSFSEFVNQKGNGGSANHLSESSQHSSAGAQKRTVDSDKHRREYAEKRMRR